MVEDLLSCDTREAPRRKLPRQIAWVEEVNVLRIVVGPARTRDDDEPAGDTAAFRQRQPYVRNVLQHLQRCNAVEGAILERHGSRVAQDWMQPPDATCAHGLHIRDAMRQQIKRFHGQSGEGVEQGPEERATPAADVQKTLWRQPAQRAKRLAHARQAHRTLEAMQPQFSLLSRRNHSVELRLTQLL